ncbi:MAG: bifunctional UDP-N-acetylglucosamine diphosphorylase/glucosamine-1-phosphate N-acetyltransferase GlmU, partial [Hyphomicrobiales bacterium]|nr:bifunctional UDP-N-acetylglucosamine diphosphorylase/glucosamine-1-phosphate N-acetyltransferase GlmU [Hyphomicrobiales bacterium]
YARLRAALGPAAAVAALAFRSGDPTGYGRMVVREGALVAIREHKDATPDELRIDLCNAGLMALDGTYALGLLDAIGPHNAQKEYYLTDAVEAARARKLGAAVVEAGEAEVMGVNDRVQLAAAEGLRQRRLREAAMRAGATLVDPASVTLCHDTALAADVTIEPHCVFARGVSVGPGATIRAFSHLEGAQVGPGATVGPFARLRPGAMIGAGAHVGNFVEIKQADIGEGAKVNHLSYVGDASVGARANVGAGAITCNYDGFDKFRTTIGAGAFVGSNSSLVAPVTVGEGAYVGSGSVVTGDVAADALAIARGRQVEKPGWAKAFRERKAAAKAAKAK